jgi:hypothetical protein
VLLPSWSQKTQTTKSGYLTATAARNPKQSLSSIAEAAMTHRIDLRDPTEFTAPGETRDVDAATDILRARIEATRRHIQETIGCPVEIDRLEPREHGGKSVLRVFWRKAHLN